MRGAAYTKLVIGLCGVLVWMGCGGPMSPDNDNNKKEPTLTVVPAPGVSSSHESPIPPGTKVQMDRERPSDKPNDPSLFDTGVGNKWIGETCANDAECSFAGGYCMKVSQGFPKGYCMRACTKYCPDRAGKPFTFCVKRASSGVCFSRCDTAKFPGSGCRPGYECKVEPRHNQSSVKRGICVPSKTNNPPLPPPVQSSWIGEPCTTNTDCQFSGGVCETESSGSPEGHCTQACTKYCPDKSGKPQTFCVARSGGGRCVIDCDLSVHPGNGCREGYVCQQISRYNEPSAVRRVCVPASSSQPNPPPPPPPPPSSGDLPTTPGLSCYDQLARWGVNFTRTSNPNTLLRGASRRCSVDAPVRLSAPVLGVDYVIWTGQRVTMLASCELAKRIARLSHYLKQRGITKVMHLGTYNCRKISGSSKLSNHSFGSAIDLGAFYAADGTEYNLVKHWDHSSTWTRNGATGCWTTRFNSIKAKVLYDIACDMWKKKFFSLILSPNYNRAHDNHFHVDLSSSGRVLSTEVDDRGVIAVHPDDHDQH